MQLLFPKSEEAPGAGIGLVDGRVRRLNAPIVPQMGWNDIEAGEDSIFEGTGQFPGYFANSFVCDVAPTEPGDTIVARAEYGGEWFAAGIRKARTWGFQFHPEKSSKPGLRLLENFVREVAR
jgi:glutamine amidotransferase